MGTPPQATVAKRSLGHLMVMSGVMFHGEDPSLPQPPTQSTEDHAITATPVTDPATTTNPVETPVLGVPTPLLVAAVQPPLSPRP